MPLINTKTKRSPEQCRAEGAATFPLCSLCPRVLFAPAGPSWLSALIHLGHKVPWQTQNNLSERRCCYFYGKLFLLRNATTPCGSSPPSVGTNLLSVSQPAQEIWLWVEGGHTGLQTAKAGHLSLFNSVLVSDKSCLLMWRMTLWGDAGQHQSRTKSKAWEKCGQTALVPVETFIFTSTFIISDFSCVCAEYCAESVPIWNSPFPL